MTGARGVGKSTFIQKALGSQYAFPSLVTLRKLAVDGGTHLVRLLEIRSEDVEVEDDELSWPETIEGKQMPKIDGALILYNITDRSSLDDVQTMLSECHCFTRCAQSKMLSPFALLT